jgi:molecular chaperone Hsp33
MSNSPNDLSTLEFDVLQTFLFEKSQVRGEIVRLGSSWQTIQQRRTYPPAIKRHLGEMVAAGALLSATLKFDGTLIIQAQGTGIVRLLVVECNANLGLRATIKLAPHIDGSLIDEQISLAELINPDGLGKLAITLDPSNRGEGQQAYQGIVPLMYQGKPVDTIAQAMMAYMHHSEQLETHISLSCNDQFASGILIQKLPQMGGKVLENIAQEELLDDWHRFNLLVNTVSDEEMLSTSPDILMQRLFSAEANDQKVMAFEPRPVHFECQCSRTRVGNMLLMLGHAEVLSILEEQHQVETTCDFCGEVYLFDPVDCEQLFKAQNLLDGMRPAQGKH